MHYKFQLSQASKQYIYISLKYTPYHPRCCYVGEAAKFHLQATNMSAWGASHGNLSNILLQNAPQFAQSNDRARTPKTPSQ